MVNRRGSEAARAARLHARAVVVDGHADSFEPVMKGERDFLVRSRRGHVDLPRMLRGGVDLQLMAVYTPKEERGPRALAWALDMTAAAHRALRQARGRFFLVRDARDLARVGRGRAPRPAILLHLEGVTPLEGRLERLELFHALGFRSMGLTHNHPSEAAGGCMTARSRERLTPFGRALVREMRARGMLLDVAHLGPRSLEQVLAMGGGPVVSTHTGLAAYCRLPVPRNLEDSQVRDIAATGGLVAIDFVPQHLVLAGRASREDVFRHLDRAVELVGDAHVGIGSDFDGYTTPLRGMPDVTAYPWFTRRMLAAGYPEASIRRILGGNFMRVLAAVLARAGA